MSDMDYLKSVKGCEVIDFHSEVRRIDGSTSKKIYEICIAGIQIMISVGFFIVWLAALYFIMRHIYKLYWIDMIFCMCIFIIFGIVVNTTLLNSLKNLKDLFVVHPVYTICIDNDIAYLDRLCIEQKFTLHKKGKSGLFIAIPKI